MNVPTWAVIPSAGRPLIHYCLDSVRDQVDGIVIVSNSGYEPIGIREAVIVDDPSPDRNISRWWNLGLDYLAILGYPQWNALVLNDDVTLEPGSARLMATALRERHASLAYPGDREQLLTQPTCTDRITGYCFMLRGETGLRADESMAWWYGDNDLDWRARTAGGTVTVPGIGLYHADPNGYTNRCPELAAQAGQDRETFLTRWGRLPH